ncbi:restriction endonuclease subunit S [Flavobacterium caseinilyticum]|uniref:Type I restriction modification DNA specificity domain-containing protein n=1 Tax=Flavobacterium caseinilyticum TaxID=2541732 RepID=A0A4V2YTH9_9FLAO|nr:restriction endonuclease subunit S [Flavobacterium caseinilyticum]TDD73657.1 hypothetical protein E0F89_16910 [Flavobacterium caseinilyticum]
MINNTGYKQTAIGLIPIDWEVKKLGQIGNFQTSSIDKLIKQNEELVFLINYMNVYKHETINNLSVKKFPVVSAKKSQIESCNLVKGDILFTPSSETPDDIGHSVVIFEDLENTVFSYHLMRFRPKVDLNILYSHFFCNNQSVLSQFTKYATGSTRFTISIKTFSNIIVPIPPLLEQQKIASILSTWDNAIDINKKILRNLEIIKKGMTINVLSGKIRFETFLKDNKISHRNGYRIPDDWEIKNLSSVLEQVKNPVKPEKDKLYKQIGIRSHTKGIFYKESVTGQSLGNKSVFAIEPDCFILNIVFAWEHAIAKTSIAELDMIVSHRFPMYKPLASKLDLDYLLFFFKSKKGKDLLGLASPGWKNRSN